MTQRRELERLRKHCDRVSGKLADVRRNISSSRHACQMKLRRRKHASRTRASDSRVSGKALTGSARRYRRSRLRRGRKWVNTCEQLSELVARKPILSQDRRERKPRLSKRKHG
jgi:hypothetical protein